MAVVVHVSSLGEFFLVVGGPHLIHRQRSNGLIGDAGRNAVRVAAGCEDLVPVETAALTLIYDEWIGGLDNPDPGDDHPLAYLPPEPG